MDLSEMTLVEVRERLAALDEEVRSTEDIEIVNKAIEEKRGLLVRLSELEDLEKRQATAKAITDGDVTPEVVEERKEITEMENKTYGTDSREYRDAFYAMIGDYATAEQRAIVVDTTNPGGGDAIAIPKSLDTKIWDNIHAAHPILEDISTVRSGVAMEVTKHTAIASRTAKKLDSASTPAEESNTFVKAVLYGYDYEKYVELTYAEAKMSAGALEDYLAEEIAAELGEALAKDVFAQILTDCGTSQKVTPAATPDLFDDLKKALGLAVLGGQKVIYAPADKYYEIVGAIKSGSPFNMGATLGVQVKLDTAATKVTVLDPKMFVLNEVQPVMVESDKDVKAHHVIVSGYLRAQGTLRNVKAAAYIN